MGDDNKPGQEGPQPGQAPQMPQLEGYAVSMAGPGGAPPQVSMAMSQAGLPTLAPAAQHTMHQQPQIHMQVRLVWWKLEALLKQFQAKKSYIFLFM